MLNAGNALERRELTQTRVQLSKTEGVFQVVKFLQLGGKLGYHQQVYHPEVFGRIVVTTEDIGGGNEIGVSINRALSGQHGIILVDLERCPLELPEVIPESPPGLDAIKCAEEKNPK